MVVLNHRHHDRYNLGDAWHSNNSPIYSAQSMHQFCPLVCGLGVMDINVLFVEFIKFDLLSMFTSYLLNYYARN